MIDIPKFLELSFNEQSHIYKLNGLQLPSVTTVMRPLSNAYYSGIDESAIAYAGKRGQAVHIAIENYLMFGVEDVPPEHMGYLTAFKRWQAECKPQIVASEGRVYHRVLRYAGTADLICAEENLLTCTDFKTSSQIIDMLVRVQLEGYAKAYDSHGIKLAKKNVVHLQKNGEYEVKSFPGRDSEAWDVFTGLLTIHNYLKKYGR